MLMSKYIWLRPVSPASLWFASAPCPFALLAHRPAQSHPACLNLSASAVSYAWVNSGEAGYTSFWTYQNRMQEITRDCFHVSVSGILSFARFRPLRPGLAEHLSCSLCSHKGSPGFTRFAWVYPLCPGRPLAAPGWSRVYFLANIIYQMGSKEIGNIFYIFICLVGGISGFAHFV